MKRFLLLHIILFSALAVEAETITDGVCVSAEVCATASSGEFAPLWLSANKHGKVSPYANSCYERLALCRDLSADSLRLWRYGYGVDVQLSQNGQSDFFIHQAYAEIGWKKAILTIGQKERTIDLRNNKLTSGGMSQGINARPIPEVRLDVDYFSFPGTKQWVKLRGRIGYGKVLDGDWQKSWIADPSSMRYTSNYLFHEKAGYVKIGKEDARVPLTLEVGLQMMTQFGGTNYNISGRNMHGLNTVENAEGLSDFWHAFWPFGSSDVTDGTEENVKGNMLGSWNMAMTWHGEGWKVRGYFERFFEDHSQLFMQYGVSDHLLGAEVELPANRYLSNVVIEHINTKEQSGAVYHDDTPSMPDEIAGRDNYYNHSLYSGWQAWGMAMGNPLITSPIYNDVHELNFCNNRITAWHVGLSGNPTREVAWRAMLTFTRNWGTYERNFDDVAKETHAMVEVEYSPRWLKGWRGTVGLGITDSEISGNAKGAQITIRKDIRL